MATAGKSAALRLVAYLRVSTETHLDGYGLAVQTQAVESWAQAGGHTIVQICTDEAVSGTVDALDREGLGCALDAIEAGEADALVIPKLDRLARKLTVQEAVLAQVWRIGGRVFAVDSGEILADDQDDPMRTAMRQMMGVFAELERSMIAKRLRDGRAAKAAAGGYAYGSPRYGQQTVDKTLLGAPDELAVIARVEDMRADGASLRAIAQTLNSEGIATKRGGKWHAATILRMIDPTAAERARQTAARNRRWRESA